MNSPMINEQTKCFKWLIDLIPTGQNEAISMTDLSNLTDLPTPEVRQQVLNARKNGVLICSGENGYYFPKDCDELKEYVKRRTQYIRTASIALNPFKKTLKSQEEGNPG